MRLWYPLCTLLIMGGMTALAADKTPVEQALADAIKSLAEKREKLDASDRAKLDKAIRGLEALITEEPLPVEGGFEVEVVRKKFSASKTTYFPKTGVLKLEYSFPSTGIGKAELADFDIGQKRVLLARKSMGIEAADEIKHIVKWKTLAVEAIVTGRTMAGVVVGSTSGSIINFSRTSGSLNANGTTVSKVFSAKNGVPIVWDINPEKVSLKYGSQVMAIPTPNMGNHQLFFRGGSDGCAIGELVLTGVPDEKWFNEHLAKE